MAIGDMGGGGIFAVLGEAVVASGNATFISFGGGGLLALLTGFSLAILVEHSFLTDLYSGHKGKND